MSILKVEKLDICNGPGCRVSVWFSGCQFHCKGCHNTHTWKFNQGEKYSFDILQRIINFIQKDFIKDLSILGGEPLHPINLLECTQLCKQLKLLFPTISIWVWTGYDINCIKHLEVMNYVNVVKCGRYVEELHFKHTYYGSKNQKIYEKINNNWVLSTQYN